MNPSKKTSSVNDGRDNIEASKSSREMQNEPKIVVINKLKARDQESNIVTALAE